MWEEAQVHHLQLCIRTSNNLSVTAVLDVCMANVGAGLPQGHQTGGSFLVSAIPLTGSDRRLGLTTRPYCLAG